MKTMQREFLNVQDRKELHEAIQAAEKQTSGEIVVAVERQSYDYPQSVFLGTLIISLTVSLGVNFLLSFSVLWTGPRIEHLWAFPSVFAVTFILAFYALRSIDALRRLFTPSRVMQEEVYEAAVSSFHTNGLGRTRDHNGILVYVSIFERRVQILADHEINDRIGKAAWETIVAEILEGIKNGRQKQALIGACEKIAALLAGHFPPLPDDRDELPNLFMDTNNTE